MRAWRSTCKVVEEFLLENDFNVDDEWRDDDEKSKDEDSGVQAGSRESVIENRIDEFGNQVAHLWANASTGLAQWEFHQSDPDFFPSIPHGHFMGRRQPKLDAYVGWIYRGAEQIGREPKKKIIALWNDTTFRDFARVAIEYYIEHFPNYCWRVADPRRLPRRRRK